MDDTFAFYKIYNQIVDPELRVLGTIPAVSSFLYKPVCALLKTLLRFLLHRLLIVSWFGTTDANEIVSLVCTFSMLHSAEWRLCLVDLWTHPFLLFFVSIIYYSFRRMSTDFVENDRLRFPQIAPPEFGNDPQNVPVLRRPLAIFCEIRSKTEPVFHPCKAAAKRFAEFLRPQAQKK